MLYVSNLVSIKLSQQYLLFMYNFFKHVSIVNFQIGCNGRYPVKYNMFSVFLD